MKIVIVGATGFVGSRILAEALSRNHEVVAMARSIEKLPRDRGLRALKADVNDVAALTDAFRGRYAVIHAYAPAKTDTIEARIGQQTRATKAIIAALKGAHVRRVLAVGGAGTAEVAPGVKCMDCYFFPKAWEGGAKSTAVIKPLLQAESDLEWTFLCPPLYLEPRERTGNYRLGKDELIFDETGRSHISVADYAVAMIDELENPKHSGQRFTVGA